MFETRSDVVRFLAVVRAGSIRRAAERLCMTQPPLTRIIARLEHRFGGRLFDRLPHGVRVTALGVAVADQARRILREFDTAKELTDTVRSGRTGVFRITADSVWSEAVIAPTFPRFQVDFPGIELRLETASRAVGLRRLEDGESDLHCGGIDEGERLPDFLRREPFLEITTGVVASRDHPLLSRTVTEEDLVHSPWVDCDPPATGPWGNDPSSLDGLLEHLYETTRTRVRTIVRSGSAGLSLLTGSPYLTWLPLTFLERLRGACLQPLPTSFGRRRYRSGFVARRSAEDLPPFRKLETMVRETALALED